LENVTMTRSRETSTTLLHSSVNMDDARILTKSADRILLDRENERNHKAIPSLARALQPLARAFWRTAVSALVKSSRVARRAELARARHATVLRECIRADIYLPVCDNAKVPFSPALLNAFRVLLTALAGGHRSGGELDGEWRAPNREIDGEPVRVFTATFAAEEATHNVAVIEEFVLRVFDQKAVCIELTPILATQF